MYGVYVLLSKKDDKPYIGYSSDVKRRVAEHKKGIVSATKERLPLELIYCELYKNKDDATKREQYFKTGWGRSHLNKILSNTLKR